jgi:multiple sugar transport system permease protein
MTAISTPARPGLYSQRNRKARRLGSIAAITAFAGALCFLFILPLIYMFSAAFEDPRMSSIPDKPLYPAVTEMVMYTDPATGQQSELTVYDVPGYGHLALVDARFPPTKSTFVNPDTGELLEVEVNTFTLQPIWHMNFTLDNFATAIRDINPDFGILFRNTFVIAISGTFGATVSAILVAYGFARFRIPGRDGLFLVLIGTIMLPFQVILIPQFIIFQSIGWTPSWLPLIVPHFFANAYNVFLLRQYFLTLPRELDEAAMMDGASPWRILTSVIIPQSWPAIMAVILFHFFYAWNDFLGPLIYTTGNDQLWPIAIGLNNFNTTYRAAGAPSTIQAGALISLIIPVAIFFVAQRVFMRGVVISGVEK